MSSKMRSTFETNIFRKICFNVYVYVSQMFPTHSFLKIQNNYTISFRPHRLEMKKMQEKILVRACMAFDRRRRVEKA